MGVLRFTQSGQAGDSVSLSDANDTLVLRTILAHASRAEAKLCEPSV